MFKLFAKSATNVFVFSTEFASAKAAQVFDDQKRLLSKIEDYERWCSRDLPGHLQTIARGKWVELNGFGNRASWIDSKPMRLRFAKAMFDAGIYCEYSDNNDDMGRSDTMIMRLREAGEQRFNPRTMNNPMCPNNEYA